MNTEKLQMTISLSDIIWDHKEIEYGKDSRVKGPLATFVALLIE